MRRLKLVWSFLKADLPLLGERIRIGGPRRQSRIEYFEPSARRLPLQIHELVAFFGERVVSAKRRRHNMEPSLFPTQGTP